MPNKNYVKGRNFEYRIKKKFENRDYLVFRTAGSHSPADLIAFPQVGSPILIQCKATTNNISKKEYEALEYIARRYGLRAIYINQETTIWVVSYNE